VAPAAVIVPAEGAPVAPTLAALERQTCRPGRILVVKSPAELDSAIGTASECDPSWVWLLDSGVAPEPKALECLLAAADGAPPPPVLLASKVLTPAGTLDPVSLPVPEVHRGDRVLAALEQRVVPLRVARRGSMLVHHQALREGGARRAVDRDLEWTARLLRRDPGQLVPSSVVVRVDAGRRPPRARIAATLRLLGALEPRERLWFAVHLTELALAARRGRLDR
jgi:hypothetical protein